MTLDEMPVEGKPVTWRYCAGVLAEAIGLLAFGWVMLVGAAALDSFVQGMK